MLVYRIGVSAEGPIHAYPATLPTTQEEKVNLKELKGEQRGIINYISIGDVYHNHHYVPAGDPFF